MNYTDKLESFLFDLGYMDDCTEEKIIEFLNDESSFRNFGEGLKDVIRNHMPIDSVLSEKEYLKEAAKEQGFSFNRNTLENWFKGVRPKKGDQSREHMYLIAFALELNIEETCSLFKKVYLDRPFDYRSANEVIYYHCLKNGLGYQHALQMLSILDEREYEDAEGTVFTHILQNDLESMESDQEVIDYILAHPHNFNISNRSAMETLESLLEEIRISDEEKDLLKGSHTRYNQKFESFLAQEINAYVRVSDDDEGMIGSYKSLTSIETMLDIITTGFTRGEAKKVSGKTLFKNANLPKEIINRFPMKQSFSKSADELSFEELRKMIILLFSYKFWVEVQINEKEGDFEEYQEQLDALLFESSLQPLYYGNPFDWLFLYCSLSEEPLDLFRGIIAEGRSEMI